MTASPDSKQACEALQGISSGPSCLKRTRVETAIARPCQKAYTLRSKACTCPFRVSHLGALYQQLPLLAYCLHQEIALAWGDV